MTESSSERKKATAIIIGAGPAGLTAAYELLDKTAIKPIVLEASGEIGGLCRTVIHRGNRLDIGGHRFFTKSDEVMRWWRNLLPLEGEPATHRPIGAAVAQELPPPDPRRTDAVLLSRPRLSRILFERRLFPYPLRVTREVLAQLGLGRAMRFAASMAAARARPIAPEKSLEDFFINRFGRALYETFFRSYTEKVWGAPCAAIGSDWGAQRVDGLSLGLALRHALRGMLGGEPAPGAAAATLAERFYYPKLGPGQLWEEAARRIVAAGGEIRLRTRLVGLRRCGDRIAAAIARDEDSRELTTLPGDFFFSSAPVGELIAALGDGVPEVIGEAASLLRHRSFIVVGLLLARLAMKGAAGSLPPDNWIYVQDGDVDAGRIQIFNNWSPALVADPRLVWVGVEYFCAEGDRRWTAADADLASHAAAELGRLGLADPTDRLDAVVVRAPKAYPAYIGEGWRRFGEVRAFLDEIENLFLIGRSGMHRYNNQDHSMLTAMLAVENAATGRRDKGNIWAVNTQGDYHEGG